MDPSKFDRRITIEQPIESTDDYGAPTVVWTLFAEVWAQLLPPKGDERFAAQQVNERIDATFKIRHLDGVNTTMRINYDGKYYDILACDPIGRREGYFLRSLARQA